jgi:4-hydroxy-tetrahydrodipicolinate synthase
MAEHPNMVLVKEATSRVGQIAKLCAAKPDMGIMCCDSPNLGLTISVMALGGQGTANMTGNILPRELATISKPWRDFNDAMNCRAAWLKNLPMLHYTYSEINPVALKSVMRAVGLPAGDLRRPLTLLEGPRLQEGLDIIRDLGVAEAYGYKLPGAPRAAAE